MNSLTYQRIVKGLAAIGILIIIIMPGEITGWLSELLHIIWELFVEFLHLLFEGIESTLDYIIEFLFETDLHNTQIIVFYILLSIVCYGLYRLFRKVPGIFQRLTDHWFAVWEFNKIRVYLYWQSLTFIDKVKLFAFCFVGIFGFIFFSF